MICSNCGRCHDIHWSQAVREYDWRADFPLDPATLPKFEMRLETFSGIAIPTDEEVVKYGG